MTGLSPEKPTLLAQTDSWLVFSKPAGWLTIPGREAGRGAEPVLSEWAEAQFGRSWVVHRIDRETSGIVLFAKNAESHRQANTWFQNHAVKKAYDCLAQGVPSAPVMKIREPIEGAPSTTQIEVKESYREGFLARVVPLTGRRHQIRIHLAAKGYALWGDTRYHGPKEIRFEKSGQSLLVSRVALHAARLELPSKEVFEAPWPGDFADWVARLRNEGQRV